jgi:hypothetical protein
LRATALFDDIGFTPEIIQIWTVVAVLVGTTVVAVVAQRRRADPKWSRVSRIAAMALVVEVILTLVWLRFAFMTWLPSGDA